MIELIPLALIGLLCWYWWRQGTRLRLEREAQEAQERAAAQAVDNLAPAGDKPEDGGATGR